MKDKKVIEAMKEALYNVFDEISDEEIINGTGVGAFVTVDGVVYYAETDYTDNRLPENASEKEIADLIDSLVQDGAERYITEEQHQLNILLNKKWR